MKPLIPLIRRQSHRTLNSKSEQVPGHLRLGSEEDGKQNSGDNMLEQGCNFSAPASSRTQHLQSCDSSFRVKNRRD